jgi:hypothetical protein
MTRSRHHTGWAGALAVAAELSRRGYDATITLGNTPALDLLCSSPEGKPFKVQVKSLSAPNWVLIREDMLVGPARDDLFFAVVLVPPHPQDDDKPFEYHVLTHAEACDFHLQHPTTKKNGQAFKPGMDGLAWAEVQPHRDRWNKLPE